MSKPFKGFYARSKPFGMKSAPVQATSKATLGGYEVVYTPDYGACLDVFYNGQPCATLLSGLLQSLPANRQKEHDELRDKAVRLRAALDALWNNRQRVCWGAAEQVGKEILDATQDLK